MAPEAVFIGLFLFCKDAQEKRKIVFIHKTVAVNVCIYFSFVCELVFLERCVIRSNTSEQHSIPHVNITVAIGIAEKKGVGLLPAAR